MRTEQQMLNLILSTARADERIRAVTFNGSRTNPNARRDCFQDFDIIYFVTELDSFLADPAWIDCFGERMILQLPDAMQDPPPAPGKGSFAYLIQFTDGNRIDLTLYPTARLAEMEHDSLTVPLLDKDSILPAFPPPDERDHLPQPPTTKAFADCCNEFWWVSAYVAKGLWRREYPYARTMMDSYVRPQLMKMLNWYVGIRTQFNVNPGRHGKFFQHYLEPELWNIFLQTYADADDAHTWDALLAMGDLFRLVALPVAAHFDYKYPHGNDARVSAHLRHVRALPPDAAEMYP